MLNDGETVLIVAKCNVNLYIIREYNFKRRVLIVAKCNVNSNRC